MILDQIQPRGHREIRPGPLAIRLERAILAALILFAIAAPTSIAAAQTAWLLGMLFWILRFAIWPRPEGKRTPIDYAMLGFFILTGISSILSYEPMVSIGKLRAASLFTIVYLVAQNVRSTRVLRLLAVLLITAAVVSALYTFGSYAFGRGVKIYGVRADSPLSTAKLVSPPTIQSLPILSGDTLEEIDGHKVSSPEDLTAFLEGSAGKGPAKIKIYRVEWNPVLEVPRGHLLPGSSPEERLGIQRWARGRDWRATGFYGQWTTYGEALQLITSLTIGLLVALPRKRSRNGALLALALGALLIALLLTVMRASQLSLLVSAALIATLGLSRRALILIGACAVPLIFAGLFVLHQKRSVGFFDQKDDSIRWRETVQREGFHLLVSKPRHLVVGVGMDSIKGHWREWELFDNGRLPWGHMHSDYLQIALERGVPALLVWLVLLGIYARTLWRLRRQVPAEKWIERGFVLGALGGLIGFMLSGIVHYNWGDSEVVMILYFIMGLSLVVERVSEPGAVATGSRRRAEVI